MSAVDSAVPPTTPKHAAAASPDPNNDSMFPGILDLSDVLDEVAPVSSDEEEAKNESPEKPEKDDRAPAPPQSIKKKPQTAMEEQLSSGFSRAEALLKGKDPLRFTGDIEGPDSKGKWLFILAQPNVISWQCTKTFNELHKLAEKLKKDPALRGLASSIPPLPEKKRFSITRAPKPDAKAQEAQRNLLMNFLKKMFSHAVFLSHHEVQSLFEIPPPLRAKIDTFQRLYQTPLLSSYLSKEGGKVKSWRRRFCILYPDFTIRYFEEKNEDTGMGKSLKGVVDVHELTKIQYYQVARSANKFCFGLVLPHREFKFETDEYDLQAIWMKGVSTLIDGPLSFFSPEMKDVTGQNLSYFGETPAASVKKTTSNLTKPSQKRQTSKDRINTEKRGRVQLLAKLAELRDMQDNLEKSTEQQKQLYRREQDKLEDDFAKLEPELVKAQKESEAAREELRTLKKTLKEEEAAQKQKLADAEARLKEVREKYGRRLPDDNRNVLRLDAGSANKRRITIERSAPAAFSGELIQYVKNGETRKAYVWFLLLSDQPYLEWVDSQAANKTESATRMRLTEVTDWSQGGFLSESDAKRFFSVKSKKKMVGFLAPNNNLRDTWVRTIRSALAPPPEKAEKEQ